MWMAEARNRQLWSHTSEILAMLANCNSKRRYTGADFNPTLPRQIVPASVADLAGLLARRPPKKERGARGG
jgi:hypothetical protein